MRILRGRGALYIKNGLLIVICGAADYPPDFGHCTGTISSSA